MNYRLKKLILTPMNLLYRINPKLVIKIIFYLKNGYKLNLTHPITYNEKLQWIKFYDKNLKIPVCADKYTVREYVKESDCEVLLNHLLWEGSDAGEIPFEKLPEQFVIKVTHGSGFNIICRDKSQLNIEKAKRKLTRWLKEKYIPCYGEWFYGIIRPRIIIEEYLGDEKGDIPNDYKVLCFNGEPKLIQVHYGRYRDHKMKLYEPDWKEIRNVQIKYSDNPDYRIERPLELDKMLEYARILSKPFYNARIDFYIVRNRLYFGEITITDGAGFDKITPYSFDMELGSYMKLPTKYTM